MNSISVFLNNKIVDENSCTCLPGIADVSVAFGNWFLTPVRCLFNGNQVTISNKDGSITVKHESEYASGRYDWKKPKKNYLRVAVFIVLIVPGLILGSVFKGLGYLSQSIRNQHRIAIQHYTPVNRAIGSLKGRVNLDAIKKILTEIKEKNKFNRPTGNLIIYAEDGTAINEDPGFVGLMPQKLILVGARIVHQPSAIGRLDEALLREPGWESHVIRSADDATTADNSTFVTQWKMKSIEAALQDIPPKLSLFSSKRYNRIYLV